jgi:hypothetical protein
MQPISNPKNSPPFEKMFDFMKPLPKLGTPFYIGIKKLPSDIYLAFTNLNHNSSGFWKIFHIHLTNKQSFIILVLMMPKPP